MVGARQGNAKPAILLIDEVDVFFSKSFYNQVYIPMLQLKEAEFGRLLDLAWDYKDEIEKKYPEIRISPQFKACKELFSQEFEGLAEEVLKDIVSDLKGFVQEGHAYKLHNGEIGYPMLDTISTKVKYGYKTVFAHYQEYFENKTISEDVFLNNRYVSINCAEFSFSEIPSQFRYIFGVTGTLKALSAEQFKIINDVYNIRNMTYSPSVYGESKLDWKDAPAKRIKINKTENEYFNDIVNGISQVVPLDNKPRQRAVLVVFENMMKLEAFRDSDQFR